MAVLVHMYTPQLWPGYRGLAPRQKLAWSNRIASAAHAVVLVAVQAGNLRDPALLADPLFAVNGAHFLWGSVMYGYLVYDTLFTLLFWRAVGAWSFLAHHALGLGCCAFGLYYNRMALFGMAIQVFFESTTPLLHLLGCLKIAGRTRSPAFLAAGLALIAQFAVCRVAIGSYYWVLLIAAVWRLPAPRPGWALGGVAVFGALIALNALWLAKLVGMARARIQGGADRGSTSATGLPAGTECKAMAGLTAAASGGCAAESAVIPGKGGAVAAGPCGRVISLSARASSLSAVEAAAHAAAYAAAKAGAAAAGSVKHLQHQNAMPHQPPAAGGADLIGVNCGSGAGGDGSTKEIESKLEAAPSLARQGMSGPLDALLPPLPSSDAPLSRHGSRAEEECHCAFCGDDHHTLHRASASKPAIPQPPAAETTLSKQSGSSLSHWGSRAEDEDCAFCGDDHHASHAKRSTPLATAAAEETDRSLAAPKQLPHESDDVGMPTTDALITPGQQASKPADGLEAEPAQRQTAGRGHHEACDCPFCGGE